MMMLTYKHDNTLLHVCFSWEELHWNKEERKCERYNKQRQI